MAHTEGTWLYNAVTGEVYVRTGEKPKGKTRVLATITISGDAAPDEVEEGDSNGELFALAPQLAAIVAEFAAQDCTEAGSRDRCGECLVCRAKDLNDEVPL